MSTLILVLSVAGFTEYSVVFTDDADTCDRWGRMSVASGEATAYRCVATATPVKKS